MALGKLVKGGSLVLAGVLVGGLLSYNSKKTEIVAGINDISNKAIEYKIQAKNLLTDKESLKESIAALNTQIGSLKTELQQLISEKAELENQSSLDANKIKELEAKIKEKDAEITRLNNLMAFKDTLFQTTYEKAVELENKVEDLTKQLEEAKKNSNNIVDKANEQIKQANQDQGDIFDAVNQAKENINKEIKK